MDDRASISGLLNFGWIKKLVKMVFFPGKVGINDCVLVHELWMDTERLNTTQIDAEAFVVEGIIACVVDISHGDVGGGCL